MPNLGATEILIILAIVLLLFGANKLPDLARSMGRSARIFKSEVKEMRREDAEYEQNAPARPAELTDGRTHAATTNPGEAVNPETRSAAQGDSFWDRPENQPTQR